MALASVMAARPGLRPASSEPSLLTAPGPGSDASVSPAATLSDSRFDSACTWFPRERVNYFRFPPRTLHGPLDLGAPV